MSFEKLSKTRSPEINLLLFSAARRDIWQQKIEPALSRGEIVISARNYFSTLAYQGRGEGLNEAEIERVTRLFTDERYMKPDLLVILTLADDKREQRIAMRGGLEHPDTFESREEDFQTRVNHAYVELAAEHDLPTIDASGTIDEIQQKIRQLIGA